MAASTKDKYALAPKFLNIFTQGFDSVWRNYNPLWYAQHSLNPFEIGLLRSIKIIGIIFGPIWSITADKFRKRRQILSLILFSCLITLKALDHFPYIFNSKLNISITLFFYTIFSVGVRPLTEGIILTSLGKDKELFGRQAMFAAIGWLVASVVCGYLYFWFGFYACWNVQVVCFLGTFYILIFHVEEYKKGEVQEMDKIGFFVKLKEICWKICEVRVLKILIVLVVQGAGSNMIESFLFLYLNRDLEAPKYVCGWTIFFTCLLEHPIFFYSHKLLKTYGINILFIIAQSAFIIRTFLYSLLTKQNVIWVLPIELLHGITYANMWTSATQFASDFCPKGLESICMLILAFCFHFIGSFLGNLIGGWLFTHYGAIVMFHCFGFTSLFTCLVFCYRCVVEYLEDKNTKKNGVNENKIELLEVD